MTQPIRIAGYQGPQSILTRGLSVVAEAALPEAELIPDVTATGLPAQALFEGIEAGAYHVGYMASGYLTAGVPDLGVLDLPFSVSDRARAFERLDGAAGAWLARAVAEATELEVLAFWDNGFRHLTNGVRPLRAPQDCAGLRVRTLNNQLYQDTMAAIGLEPVVTDVKELIAACQSGRVDAQENPLTNMLSFGLDQWHGHVSLTGHIFGIVLLVANRRWFAGLPEGRQRRLRQAARVASGLQRRLAAEMDETGLKTLRARGVAVLTRDEIDLAAFRAATDSLRASALKTVPDQLVATYLD